MLNWNNGMYSASTSTAMTTPISDQQRRLDHRDEPADRRFHFLVVEIGQAAQHVLQRARRLPHFDHLQRDVRHDLARRQRCRQPLPFAHALGDDIQLLRHVVVADRTRGHLQRIHQRDAAAEQRRQRARHLRGDELASRVADERNRQHARDRTARAGPAAESRRRTPRWP